MSLSLIEFLTKLYLNQIRQVIGLRCNCGKRICVFVSMRTFRIDTQGFFIQEKTLRINAEGTHADEHTDTLTAVASQPNNLPNLIEVKLSEKLNEGQAHTLSIPEKQLSDGTGVPITAKGVITIPGLASPPDDPNLTLEIATNAAVHQKPQFDFDLAWAPYQKYHLQKPAWFWQPEIKIDVGLGDSKSDNAVSLALLADYSSDPSCIGRRTRNGDSGSAGKCEAAPDDVQLKTFYKWRRTPWYRLRSYDFFIGPKLEETAHLIVSIHWAP